MRKTTRLVVVDRRGGSSVSLLVSAQQAATSPGVHPISGADTRSR